MDWTRVRTAQFQHAAARDYSASPNAYKGLIAHAAPGLHAFVADLAASLFPAGARLMDIAAGSGALTLRLQDAGFVMQAADYVAENFRPNIPFTRLDLNQPFAERFPGSFDGIVALEIIEHLENPRHFLRECRKLVPSGQMIVTTPNAGSPASKTLFMRSGHFAWHSPQDYTVHGHITPITALHLQQCAAECGFTAEMSSYGNDGAHVAGSPRMALLRRIVGALAG